jgi:hypothetical protein
MRDELPENASNQFNIHEGQMPKPYSASGVQTFSTGEFQA